MTRLSVNLNKVALMRNSRGPDAAPSLIAAAETVLDAGAHGLTLHPRADQRHATLADVAAFGRLLRARPAAELNIEGDIRPGLFEAALDAGAHQLTIVPVEPGELTSHRGWRAQDDQAALARIVALSRGRARVSVFVDADPTAVERVAAAGAEAIELFTGPYAQAAPERRAALLRALAATAERARAHRLRVNAGHDLTLGNIAAVIAAVRPDEVSIGHALVADALWCGLARSARQFLDALAAATGSPI